jgi:hypothetical protein
VLYAADHPERKQYWVGESTVVTLIGQKFIAPLLDRYLGRTGYDSQQTDERVNGQQAQNLWQPVDQDPGSDRGARGDFDDKSYSRSPQLWFSHHPVQGATGTMTLAMGALLAVRGVLGRRR